MTNIYELIYSALSPLGYPVREQGTFASGETLPETFITYLVVAGNPRSHADNQPTSKVKRVQIALYSKKPSIKQAAEAMLDGRMLPAGFMHVDHGDLPYDARTGHYGYRVDYRRYDTVE